MTVVILVSLAYLVLLGLLLASAHAPRRVEGVSPGLAALCLLVGREASDLLWRLVLAESVPLFHLLTPGSPCGESERFSHMLTLSGVGLTRYWRGGSLQSRAAYLCQTDLGTFLVLCDSCFLRLLWQITMDLVA